MRRFDVYERIFCRLAYGICESDSVSLFGRIGVTMRRIIKGFRNLEKVGAEDRGGVEGLLKWVRSRMIQGRGSSCQEVDAGTTGGRQ